MSALGERDRLALDLLYAAWAVCEDPDLDNSLVLLFDELEQRGYASALRDSLELPMEASREEVGEWLLTGLGSVPC